MTTETSLFTTIYGPKFMDKLSNRDAHLVSCIQQDLANSAPNACGVSINTSKSINGQTLTILLDTCGYVKADDIKQAYLPLTSQMLREQDSGAKEFVKQYTTGTPLITEHYGYETTINGIITTVVVTI